MQAKLETFSKKWLKKKDALELRVVLFSCYRGF